MAQVDERPLVRLAELEIDPAHLGGYRALLAEEIEASVSIEPGVLLLSAVADKDNAARIRILEIYADEDAYQAHLRSPHFLRYKALTADMVRSLTLTETDPVMIRGKPGTHFST